ncbi:hypothetical protein EDF59_12194 [Novosphingobium sp. ST904]|nr:hypothetical protein EDF59_12194 [Novosphingobium sp. ST904]
MDSKGEESVRAPRARMNGGYGKGGCGVRDSVSRWARLP